MGCAAGTVGFQKMIFIYYYSNNSSNDVSEKQGDERFATLAVFHMSENFQGVDMMRKKLSYGSFGYLVMLKKY